MTSIERRRPKTRSILVGAVIFAVGLLITGVALYLVTLTGGDFSAPLGSRQKVPAGFAVIFSGVLAVGTLTAGVISIVLAGRGDPALATPSGTDGESPTAPTRMRSIVVGGVFLLLAVLMIIAAIYIVAKVDGDLSTLVGAPGGGGRRSLGRIPAWVAISYIGLYTVLCAGFGLLVMLVGWRAAAAREKQERLVPAS